MRGLITTRTAVWTKIHLGGFVYQFKTSRIRGGARCPRFGGTPPERGSDAQPDRGADQPPVVELDEQSHHRGVIPRPTDDAGIPLPRSRVGLVGYEVADRTRAESKMPVRKTAKYTMSNRSPLHR